MEARRSRTVREKAEVRAPAPDPRFAALALLLARDLARRHLETGLSEKAGSVYPVASPLRMRHDQSCGLRPLFIRPAAGSLD
jgi:hypothetical protein